MLNKAHITRLRSLQEKRNREALGLFVVEGEKVVAELLKKKDYAPIELYLTEDGPAGIRAHPLAQMITAEQMQRISHFPTPSTTFAVIPQQRKSLELSDLRRGRTLALDGVQDAGNVGTLIRIADWFGFDRVLLSLDCADLFSQKVINASMGSFTNVPIYTHPLAPSLREIVSDYKIHPDILGCDLVGENLHSVEPLANVIVVIGSEGRGLSKDVRECITRFVTIPRFGHAESLNAATAAAIVCDQMRRKKI
ncbi:MAG TPA: RNA methyltransferase [Opitutaceae bacterium]